MVATGIWLLLAAVLFWWNHFHTPFIGVRFTEKLFGAPVGGQWLCLLLAGYCGVRALLRKRRSKHEGTHR